MASVVGRLERWNEQSLSGVCVDGRWFNGPPSLIQPFVAKIKRGDMVRVVLKEDGGKRLIDLERFDPAALEAIKDTNLSGGTRVLDDEGNVIYTTQKEPEQLSKDYLIIRQVAAKCATELSVGKDVEMWDSWFEYINKKIKGDI